MKSQQFSPQKFCPLGPVHLDWISDKLDYLSWPLGQFFFISLALDKLLATLGSGIGTRFFVINFHFRTMCIVSVLLRMQYSSFSNLEATRKNIDPLGRIKIRFNSICIKSIVPGKVYCFSDIGMQQLFFPMGFSLSGKKI